jgi:radical SAM protein with 4Fe4S-binding SPASM domain
MVLRVGIRRPGSKLRIAYVETTLRCDQSCSFCGSRAGRHARQELSTEELLDVFEQVVSLGAETIHLTGGEAYLRDDWLTLVQAVHALGVECTLITAGWAIDEPLALRAREAGLDRVGVSLDGLAEIHDSLRATPGSFDRGRRAIEAFRKAGVPVACNTQLNALNWRELPRLADVLLTAGLYGWQLQLMIPMGRASEAKRLWLQPFDMLEVIPLVASVIERCSASGLPVGAACNLGYFGPHEQSLRKLTSTPEHTRGCAAGVAMISIDSAGNVAGCSALDASDQCGGNVRSQSIRDCWESAPELRLGFARSPTWGYCSTCYYASICRGGCSATAIAVTGRRGNNPYCHHRALELASRGLRERLVPRDTATVGRRGYARFALELEPSVTDKSDPPP